MSQNKTFIILGPDGGDDLPMHWDHEFWQWVESGAPSEATLYSEEEIFSFPSGELPVGVGAIMDMATGIEYVPLPPGGGENKI